MKFELGQTVMTRGVAQYIEDKGIPPLELAQILSWHGNGLWGDIPEEDKRANDEALTNGGRILSAYELRGERVWIITEADRSYTTILFPDEY